MCSYCAHAFKHPPNKKNITMKITAVATTTKNIFSSTQFRLDNEAFGANLTPLLTGKITQYTTKRANGEQPTGTCELKQTN